MPLNWFKKCCFVVFIAIYGKEAMANISNLER